MADSTARIEDEDVVLAARIVAAGGQDREAAEAELCRRLAPRIRLFGLKHLRDRDAAADLVQQVLLITLEGLRAGKVREPVVVILLSITAVIVALVLLRPPHRQRRPWIPRTAAWIACGMLSLRGIAGAVVDGFSDPIWWPTFLTGGILFGVVAWLARDVTPRRDAS